MTHSLIILGSGQDAGSPQVGTFGSAGPARAASSIAVISDDGSVLLFDASPDIRLQYQRLAAHLGFAPPLDGVFITHGHMGHYAGLLHFGKEGAATDGLPLFAPQTVLDFLDENEPWASLMKGGHMLAIPIDDATAALGEITVSAVPVPHRAEFTGTVGYSISIDDTPWAFYLPDIDGWDEWPEAEAVLASHDVCLIDATFCSTDELPGRDIAAIKHPLVPNTITRFQHLTRDREMILTHINHSNPLGNVDADITARAREFGFAVAHDGLVIDRG
ncbi:MAG: MBL fold metallo-hydrolase [Actinomycetota bacterium]